jgi:transposase
MPKKLYQVELTESERDHLINLVSSGTAKARKLTRARILLKAHEKWTDEEISKALDVGNVTVYRIRKRYVEEGLTFAVEGKPSARQYECKLDGRQEAHLVALVCGPPPAGYANWTLRLLADKFIALEAIDIPSISHETIRQVLKKTNLSLGKINNG